MDIREMIRERHSVRQFTDNPIPEELRGRIQEVIRTCNAESGLSIQAIYDDPECFQTLLAHYGKGKCKADKAKTGPFTKVDLGIVRYHFEAVTGRKCEVE